MLRLIEEINVLGDFCNQYLYHLRSGVLVATEAIECTEDLRVAISLESYFIKTINDKLLAYFNEFRVLNMLPTVADQVGGLGWSKSGKVFDYVVL